VAEPIDEYFTTTISAMDASERRRVEDESVRDGSSLTTRALDQLARAHIVLQ